MKLSLVALMFAPVLTQAQTLTGAAWFASTATGSTNISQAYAAGYTNTLGGDQWFDLWMARNADASLPINGPTDEEAGIFIPLSPGNVYAYYLFTGSPCCAGLTFSGFNLFFDGHSSSPDISVFGPNNGFTFSPDASQVLSLEGNPATGAGTSFYSGSNATVVLSEFNWQPTQNPPINVSQPFAFTPGSTSNTFGSFTLRVFQSAAFSVAQSGGAPFTNLSLSGAGYSPNETVYIYAGAIGARNIFATATADATGAFAISASEPQRPYGPIDVFALGSRSQRLGASKFSVTPALSAKPAVGAPGSSVAVRELGFGAGETVNVYWNNPRVLAGTAVANTQGSASVEITIPPNAAPGLAGLIGIGQTTQSLGLGAVYVR